MDNNDLLKAILEENKATNELLDQILATMLTKADLADFDEINDDPYYLADPM